MEDGLLEPPRSPDVLIRHASGILSILTLLFSVLLILTYGTGAAFRAIRVFFTALVLLVHAVSIAKFFTNGAYSEKDFRKSFFLSCDVHSVTIFLLFTIADLTPILTIINYAIGFAVTALNYLVADVLPYLGQNDHQAIEMAKRFATHQAVTFLPIYLELALIFQLFVIMAADWSLINLATFVIYIAWIVMFNYAVSPPHKQVWGTIGRWVGAHAEANRGSYGHVVERIAGWVAVLGNLALHWYQ
jgi:hypothetical protein